MPKKKILNKNARKISDDWECTSGQVAVNLLYS